MPTRLLALTIAVVACLAGALALPAAGWAAPSAVGAGGPIAGPHGDASPPPEDVRIAPGVVRLAEPSEVLLDAMASARLGDGAGPAEVEAAASAALAAWHASHPHGPDGDAFASLVAREAAAAGLGPEFGVAEVESALSAGGRSRASSRLARAAQTSRPAISGTMRLLVMAVEFAGSDTATISHPRSMTDRTCVTETLTFTGPLHGRIPAPGPRDNNTLWLPEFGASYYERVLFSTEGVTERVRLDLVDPEDGLPGIDMSGQTMQAYLDEASRGRVKLESGPGGTVAWIQVPHSEAWYGASQCEDGRAPDVAAMDGLPGNRGGPAQLVRDALDVIRRDRPGFPWAAYDADGNGEIDHVIVFHAGKDKSNGGGVQSWQALWAHAGGANHTVDDRGTPGDRSDDLVVGGYTMQYEDAEPGVLIHEFGHDLGLPDLYDTSRGGSTSAEYWDVMGAGNRCGKLNSTNPVQMSTWSRMALGWSEPTVVTPTETAVEVRIGQGADPPAGTADGVRVNLPPVPQRQVTFPVGSQQAWWTGNDQSWADVTLSHDLSLVGVAAPITASFDLYLSTQTDRDYLFLEVSADGGRTFTQTKGFQVSSQRERTTPDTYADPNCLLAPHPERPECAGRPNYGGLAHGYTGSSSRWQGASRGFARVFHDLSPYAGGDVVVRFRYATDAAVLGRGAYVDRFVVRAGERVVFDDPVEADEANDWTSIAGSFVPGTPVGAGWRLHGGIFMVGQYYLIEWRNTAGFDRGLRYGYNQAFSTLTADGRSERRVDVVPMNVPGMVVWLRDQRFGSDPTGASNSVVTDGPLRSMPSEGPKGGVLVVDSHPEPLRGDRGGLIRPVDPETGARHGPFPFPPLDNWGGRVQTSNAAFGLAATAAVTLTASYRADDPSAMVVTATRHASLPAAPAFHDALGYYPGVELLPVPVTVLSTTTTRRIKAYALTDPDAGVVIPAKGYYPPRTPDGFTGLGAETGEDVSTDETIYNFDVEPRWLSVGAVGGTEVVGRQSGHPGSDELQHGLHFQVVKQAEDGSYGIVRLWRSHYAAEPSGTVDPTPCPTGDGFVADVAARNVGSPARLLLYVDLAAGGLALTGCGEAHLPVAVGFDVVQRVLLDAGPEMMRALRVDPSAATGVVVWSGDGEPLDTGTSVTARVGIRDRSAPGNLPPLPPLDAVAVTEMGVPVRVFLPTAATGRP